MSIWVLVLGCVLLGFMLLLAAAYINVSTENQLQKKEIAQLRKTNEELSSIVARRAWGEYE